MLKITTPWAEQGFIPPYDWHNGFVGRCCAADEVDSSEAFEQSVRGLTCFITKENFEFSKKENQWLSKVSLGEEFLYVKGSMWGERKNRPAKYTENPGKNQPQTPYASVYTGSSCLGEWLKEATLREIPYIFSITGIEEYNQNDSVFIDAGFSKYYVSPTFCNLQYYDSMVPGNARLFLTIWKKD